MTGGDLLKDVRVLHFAVVLGKFDRKDDAGDEEDQAPPQAEPECILRSGGGEEVDIMQSKRKMFFYNVNISQKCRDIFKGPIL